MHICVQTFGSQAVGPYNCTVNYMYDSSNDKFHYLNGPCDIAVSHEHTDMMIQDIVYDSKNDQLNIDFQSHGPTGGKYTLTHSDTPQMKCDPATNALPFEYCKNNMPATVQD